MADLIFRRPATSGSFADLRFGAVGGDFPLVTAAFTGVLPAMTLAVAIGAVTEAAFTAVLPPMTLTVVAAYDSATARPTVGQVSTAVQLAAPLEVGSSEEWHDGARADSEVVTRWQQAEAVQRPIALGAADALAIATGLTPQFQDTIRLAPAQYDVVQQDAARTVRLARSSRMQDAWSARAAWDQQLQDALRDPRRLVGVHWGDGIAAGLLRLHLAGAGQPIEQGAASRFQDGRRPGAGVTTVPPPPAPQPCYTPPRGGAVDLRLSARWTNSGRLLFTCRRAEETPAALVIVPIRRCYVVANSVALRRVDGDVPLPAYGFSMSLDADSWTWSFNATLRAESLPYVQRGAGDPVEIEATVNGQPFRLRVERVERLRQFSPTRVRIAGRGLAATLAAPHAPMMSFAGAIDRTAQQLANDVLSINGVPLGWDVDWQLADWFVPAGAWSLQGAYMDAITDIATAAGGYVQPHPTAQQLRILPRYPTAPWAWGSVTPDFELPAAAVEVETTEWVDLPAYNRVYVGGTAAGVFGPVTRTGTAGDLIAPQVTHALITAEAVHRQRGLAELANTGRQSHVKLQLQVLPETGLITPGAMVRHVGEEALIGIVRSTSVEWNSPRLRQTIGVETHVAAA